MAKKRAKKPTASHPEVTIREWLTANKEAYDDQEDLIAACMDALGVSRPGVRLKLREMGLTGSQSKGKRGLSRAEFKRQFDEETAAKVAIAEGLKKLGADDILPDVDFKRFCGANPNGWRDAAADFREYQFSVGTKIFWATKATVQEMIRDVRKGQEV